MITSTPPSTVEVDPWVLVTAAQAGDSAAVTQLYDRYVNVVFRFVFYRVADRQLAEDLTGDTFVRALRSLSGVRYQGRDFGAWLVTIARNLILDHVKSSRHRLEVSVYDVHDSSIADIGTEGEALAGLTAAAVHHYVAQLGADQQECIRLRFIQGLSVAETATAMGRNDGAIKALQHRAVRRLAQLLPREWLYE